MDKSLLIGFAIGAAAVGGGVLVASPSILSGGLAAVLTSASTPTNPVVRQIACGRIALKERERAIFAATKAFQQTSNAAYMARAKALDSAYVGKTRWADVTKPAGDSVSAFAATVNTAQATLKAANEAAVRKYNEAVLACASANPVANTDAQLVPTTASSTRPVLPGRTVSTSTILVPSTALPSKPGSPSIGPVPSRSVELGR